MISPNYVKIVDSPSTTKKIELAAQSDGSMTWSAKRVGEATRSSLNVRGRSAPTVFLFLVPFLVVVEENDVAVVDDVFAPFRAGFASFASADAPLVADHVVVGDHFRADKAFLYI